MNYTKKQSELDVKKWIDSEIKNYDTCGEYSYCANCNKNEAYPCAYAYERYTALVKTIKNSTSGTKKLKTSTTTKRSTCSRNSSSMNKKTFNGKTTTSKSSTRKPSTRRSTNKNTVKA